MRLHFQAALVAIALAFAAPSIGFAQDTMPPATEAAPAPEMVETPAPAEAAPFDADAATDAYVGQLTGEAKEKSDAYFEGGYVLDAVDVLYTIVVAAILLFFRISTRMRDFAQRWTRVRFIHSIVYVVQFVLVMAVLTFPYTVYRDFLREHEYGLSNQDFPEWGGEFLIGLGVDVILLSVFIAILYAIVARVGPRWWMWGTAASIVFLAFVVLISPVYISPLFNDYTPLEDGPIKERILGLAHANGIATDDVYRFDASKQSKRISANVSGLAGTMRISLNDNLLNRGTPEEIAAVMAHEIGHYVLNHIYEMMAWMTIMLFVAFAFVNWAFGGLVGVFGERWRVAGIADPAGLPLAIALFTVFFWVITPVWNTMIRSNEAEADIFGLNAAREADGFASVAMKLSEYRKIDPEPWEEFVFYDHPSGRSRVSMAMHWKAENLETK